MEAKAWRVTVSGLCAGTAASFDVVDNLDSEVQHSSCSVAHMGGAIPWARSECRHT